VSLGEEVQRIEHVEVFFEVFRALRVQEDSAGTRPSNLIAR
jgi:hypothetical protein